MKSTATDVAAYIAQAPPERPAALNQLRSFCRELLADYEECLEYGMPAYRRKGAVDLAFASQKQYISLYVMKKDVVDRHRAALSDAGKGCIRIRRPPDIAFDVVRSLLVGTVQSASRPC